MFLVIAGLQPKRADFSGTVHRLWDDVQCLQMIRASHGAHQPPFGTDYPGGMSVVLSASPGQQQVSRQRCRAKQDGKPAWPLASRLVLPASRLVLPASHGSLAVCDLAYWSQICQ